VNQFVWLHGQTFILMPLAMPHSLIIQYPYPASTVRYTQDLWCDWLSHDMSYAVNTAVISTPCKVLPRRMPFHCCYTALWSTILVSSVSSNIQGQHHGFEGGGIMLRVERTKKFLIPTFCLLGGGMKQNIAHVSLW